MVVPALRVLTSSVFQEDDSVRLFNNCGEPCFGEMFESLFASNFAVLFPERQLNVERNALRRLSALFFFSLLTLVGWRLAE